MRPQRALINLVAALLTPLALLLISGSLLAQLDDLSNPLRVIIIGTSLLFVIGVSLWKPISPLFYGVALLAGFVALAGFLKSVHSGGNRVNIIVALVVSYGVVLGVAVAVIGSLLRARQMPRRFVASLVMTAVLISAVGASWVWWVRYRQSFTIFDRLEEIRRAEVAYAAAQPDHAFTCNGGDLPGFTKLDWQPAGESGAGAKSRVHLEGHWVTLTCPLSAHPNWVEIMAVSYTQRISVVRVNQQ